MQAFGGAMLMSNSAAILTDAFPPGQRGMALGINQVAGISGQFVGLLLGGLLSAWDWRAVFWVNLPFGLFGTVWAYKPLKEIAEYPQGARSTGSATSPSRRARASCSPRSPSASARTTATRPAGPTRWCSAG